MVLQLFRKALSIFLSVLSLSFPLMMNGQSNSGPIPFDTLLWDLTEAKVADHLGRSALSGMAILKEASFGNGVIEFDLAVTGQRSYPGVIFRMLSDDDYERVYFRPHLPPVFSNVVQYVGAYNGIDSWQLYSGEGYTSSCEIPKDQWVHVKIEVKGTQARVTIGNRSAPTLIIRHLAHGDRSGGVGLYGPADGSAFFSNFSITHGEPNGFPPESQINNPFGVITKWEMSPVFKAADIDPEQTPAGQGLTAITWQPVTCRPDGIVDISRYTHRRGNSPDVVYLRTFIESAGDASRLFSFGYSDMVSVFFNGKLLFQGNSAYTSRDPSFQGIVGLNDYISLPLRKGKNELIVALSESFGGWGLIFRDATAVFTGKNLTKKWEIRKGLRLPESAAWDSVRQVIYLSNFYNDGKEFISRINADGKIIDTLWVQGIAQPSGMCLHNDRLFVVGRMALVEIDPESKTIIARYRFPEPGLPNDVTADDKGNLYISDSRKNAIYRLSEGKMELWLQDDGIGRPNGILADGDDLLLGTSADGSIKKINLSSKQITRFAFIGDNAIIDGLTHDGKGGYLISDFNGKVYRLTREGSLTLILDSTAPETGCADMVFIPEKRLLVIPSLYTNRVVAYELLN